MSDTNLTINNLAMIPLSPQDWAQILSPYEKTGYPLTPQRDRISLQAPLSLSTPKSLSQRAISLKDDETWTEVEKEEAPEEEVSRSIQEQLHKKREATREKMAQVIDGIHGKSLPELEEEIAEETPLTEIATGSLTDLLKAPVRIFQLCFALGKAWSHGDETAKRAAVIKLITFPFSIPYGLLKNAATLEKIFPFLAIPASFAIAALASALFGTVFLSLQLGCETLWLFETLFFHNKLDFHICQHLTEALSLNKESKPEEAAALIEKHQDAIKGIIGVDKTQKLLTCLKKEPNLRARSTYIENVLGAFLHTKLNHIRTSYMRLSGKAKVRADALYQHGASLDEVFTYIKSHIQTKQARLARMIGFKEISKTKSHIEALVEELEKFTKTGDCAKLTSLVSGERREVAIAEATELLRTFEQQTSKKILVHAIAILGIIFMLLGVALTVTGNPAAPFITTTGSTGLLTLSSLLKAGFLEQKGWKISVKDAFSDMVPWNILYKIGHFIYPRFGRITPLTDKQKAHATHRLEYLDLSSPKGDRKAREKIWGQFEAGHIRLEAERKVREYSPLPSTEPTYPLPSTFKKKTNLKRLSPLKGDKRLAELDLA